MTDNLLKTIKSPADLRRLQIEQLPDLADEIRRMIMAAVSRRGGHLASNLGVVELTIALHYVFDFSRDRLTWDVGHQCYVHKILTGRAEMFDSLRQEGGIGGFPDPAESEYDQFVVGHAGTAIGTAVGLALGAQMRQTDEKVVAVVGDASIVNGLSFEGLNNTALLKRQLLIILNDNHMAIDRTQGAFANYLARLRLSRPYEDLHRRTKIMVQRVPYFGEALEETLHRIKGGIKTTLQSRQIFEQLGIPYFGPIDGHDIASLVKLLGAFKDVNYPVMLHVQTEKGRGFTPACQDPCAFHSPQPFEVNGETVQFPAGGEKTFTTAFAEALSNLMAADERIIALTAAMPDGTGLAQVRRQFPQRVIDVGIAESVAVDIAAGLAKCGLRPVVAIYSTFLQRSFDQIFQEVSLQNLPVVFCLDRAGLVGGDGAVHHGFCDITLLRTLPNLVLMAPMDEEELNQALIFALQAARPCVLRYPRDRLPPRHPYLQGSVCEPFALGRARKIRTGADGVVLAYGGVLHEVLQAVEILEGHNIQTGVVNARFAKPVDEVLLGELLGPGQDFPVFTVEDHALAGGFGSAVMETAQKLELNTRRIIRLGLPDRFIKHKSRHKQLVDAGIDAHSIAQKVSEILGRCWAG